MIIDLPDTTTGEISRRLLEMADHGGASALGRVMTLVVPTEDGHAEGAIKAANAASREHPCRVIALVRSNRRGASRLDAQLRFGGDAGASEVVILRLYGALADHGDSVVMPFLLPDAPTVAWWPGEAPDVPSEDAIGAMARRRICDATQSRNPLKSLKQRAARHAPGDTDFAWTRVTLWRGLLAAALDEPPYEPVSKAVVKGGSDSPSTDVLAAWLALHLACPVKRVKAQPGAGLVSVQLQRSRGSVSLTRPDGTIATLSQPGQPDRRISLPPRQDPECLAEELRRLDPDDVYADVVIKGLPLLERAPKAASKESGPA